ncbi:MAG: hypothetical protein AAB478_03565, partial [Patescibacteria group bacterium]
VTPGHTKEQKTQTAQNQDQPSDTNDDNDSNNDTHVVAANNPTPTPTTTQSNSTTTGNSGQHVTVASNGGGNNSFTSAGSDTNVLGASTTLVKGSGFDNVLFDQGSKAFTINLAWFLLVLPALGLIFIGRKIYIKKQLNN